MPVLQRPDAEIHYLETGSGFPILLFAPGGLRSRMEMWHSPPGGPARSWNDWTEALAGTDFMPLPYRARSPRVRIEARARLRLGARYRSVVIHNISQGGANVEPIEPEDVHMPVVLMIGDLPPIPGRVCWHDQGCGGIAFDNLVPLDMLGKWVAEVRQREGEATEGQTFEGGPFCFPMRRENENAKIFRPLFFGRAARLARL